MFLFKADASTRLSYLIRTATALKCCNEDAIYKNKAGLIQKFEGRRKSEEGKAARLLSLLFLRVRRSGCQRHSAWYHSINQLLHKEQQTRTSSRTKSRRALTLLHTAHNDLSESQLFHRSLQMQHRPKKRSVMCPHTVYRVRMKGCLRSFVLGRVRSRNRA